MITRFATLFSRLAALVAITALMTACGGGGGGGGGGFIDGPGDGGTEDAYFLTLTLEDADGNPTNTVSTSRPMTLRVKVSRRSANGAAISDALVSAQADLGTLTPATALSNSEGFAVFTLEAGSDRGAGAITASVTNDDGVETTQTLNYQVGSPGLRLGHFEDGLFIENEIGVNPGTDLVYRGSAELFVDIVDENGERVTSTESVTLRSNCLATGKAELDPASPLETSTGSATTTFTAIDCAGDDEITATLSGSSGTAFVTLSIGSPRANSLTFVSADPDLIVLKGTGGGANRQESSIVTFRVVDSSNNPLPDVDVNFSLTTSIGGLALTPSSDTSDDDGLVQVTLLSGDVATAVRVIASVLAGDGTGQTLSTVSDILTVSTGLPDQNSISLSVTEGFVVENGFSVDGIERTINVRMADKFNNPVPDGTSAVFTTEYGSIDPSCTTTNGGCSVTWRSQAPRYPTLPDTRNAVITIDSTGPVVGDLGPVRGGRSTILVTAIGEESFIDRNGNGIMDEAEQDLFDNLPEAFIDHNENGLFDPARAACEGSSSIACISGAEEIFVDFNNDNRYNSNTNPAWYNGLLCPPEGDGVWCSRSLLNVRASTTLILSAGEAFGWFFDLTRNGSSVTSVSEGNNYFFNIADIFNNRPPADSTITVEAEGGCILASQEEVTVPNNTSYGAFSVPVSISTESGDNEGSQSPVGCPTETGRGTITITLNLQEGTSPAPATYNCSWVNNAPAPAQADPNNPTCN
ncbi:hypothetical protein FV139_15825 [Parahaliea maris]|uniref:Big-1 domain-containing protein n=1 Tax=Parahaliea maris TaxID=2716870 RepID=A0A5C8ZX87_9GAMM|nr:Ig-like domain-containing protein [Parahaliea maris]TXS92180.1 hypothetical protein FV139_15825 [Parahaliea maris]